MASGRIDVNRVITRVMPMTDFIKGYGMIEKKEALSIVSTP